MSRFIQFHLLTSYPPANLNRDDTGRPKTALVGEALRLRISSQSLKRAWRTSDMFQEALTGHIGTRTKRMGARAIAGQFGKLKSEKKTEHDEDLEIEQLAHFGPQERDAAVALARICAERGTGPDENELDLLRKPERAVDIAMFGRMLADTPAYNVEAAVQVAHAFTVHKAAVEDDYFSAVDDLNDGREDAGAGHIGERGYGAGVFYLYLCINRDLLLENLGGDAALAERALEALVHAVTKVAPTGMQNSFASRAYAAFALAEKGDQQPRSLAQAFLKPVQAREGMSLIDAAVAALDRRCANFDQVYGACADGRYRFNVEIGEGSLRGFADFVKGA
jgi:CRISPR system Cascade subunit CasC